MYRNLFTGSVKYVLLISVIVNVTCFIVGFIALFTAPVQADPGLENYRGISLIPDKAGAADIDTACILTNNLIVVALLVMGTFLAGIPTIINLIINGFMFGAQIGLAVNIGMQADTILKLTLPHGVLELPAIWLAGAAGFKVPFELVRYVSNKKGYVLDKRDLLDLILLASMAFVLIVIAALIEGNITKGIFYDTFGS